MIRSMLPLVFLKTPLTDRLVQVSLGIAFTKDGLYSFSLNKDSKVTALFIPFHIRTGHF